MTLKKEPENLTVLTQLGILHLLEYRDIPALEYLQQALKYNPLYGPALAVTADLFRFTNFHKEAHLFYSFAQNINPK